MSDHACERGEVPFVMWTCLWLVGASFAVVLAVKDFLTPALDHRIGRDFTNMWTAGKLALDGRGYAALDVDTFRLGLFNYLHMPSLQNFSYPPHALLLDAPFAFLPYYAAFIVWSVASFVLFVWAAKRWLPPRFPPILAALTPAACINLWNGHYGLFLGALWLLFFVWLHERPIRSGVAAALLTIKPHLGLAIAMTALTKRNAIISAVVFTAFLIVISALIFGPDSWSSFLFKTTAVQDEILNRGLSGNVKEFYLRMMPSAYVTWGRGKLAIAAQIVVSLAAVALVIRHRYWDPFVAATVTFLIVPYVFNYDLTVACLGFAILMFRHWDDLRNIDRAILIAAFMAPNLTFFGYVCWIIPLALLCALWLQLRFADYASPTDGGSWLTRFRPTTGTSP